MDKTRTPNQPEKKTAPQDLQQQKHTQGQNEPKAATKADAQQQQPPQKQKEK
ncbi:hypothetical protein [Oceanisphaera sp. KMM 10153]|uniref:hypothetical protein n=1 Tax=Oceanisphaera submarina TaxID=3390193 RepID=UPI003975D4B7